MDGLWIMYEEGVKVKDMFNFLVSCEIDKRLNWNVGICKILSKIILCVSWIYFMCLFGVWWLLGKIIV